MSSVQQLLGYLVALYVGWRILRSFARRSPLENIPGPASESFISGNVEKIMDPRASWDYQRGLVERYGRLCTIHGLFSAKWLYTYDPRALQSIFIKDQDVFEETDMLITSFKLLTGPGLISTLGDQHRRQRKMLNPVFSAKHLRGMTPIFNAITHRLVDAISSRVEKGTMEIDVLGWMSRTALDLIGQGGLGYSFDPLTEDKADDFADSLKAFFPISAQIPMAVQQLLPWLVRIGPSSFRRRVVEIAPHGTVTQRMKHISDVMYARSTEIVNEKKAALTRGDVAVKEQLGEGKDLMSVLLQANMTASVEDRLTDEEVIAQVSYSPVRAVFRIVPKDAMLPLSAPIRGLDGSLINVVPVTKGMRIATDIEASNCNKEIWGEDAYEWKPERWLKPLPPSVDNARIPGVYSHLMTFIGGSRSCIGFKFSQLEMKIVLAMLLPAFRFELSERPVFWNAAGVAYPSAGDYSTKPEMPLRVTRITL
ncbi:cytochrome P450 [Cubamyces sp. BRFM 1775]|nr:cytochrome P450 [Cubamyces sp. BRFM 1775]